MFPFNPFFSRRRFPFLRINANGLPLMFSISAITHLVDDAQAVTYSLHPFLFRLLPSRGVFLFEVRHQPVPTPNPTDPVYLSVTGNALGSPSNRSPLMLPDGTQATVANISVGGRYFVFYNRCDCSFQLLNVVTPVTTAAPTSVGLDSNTVSSAKSSAK